MLDQLPMLKGLTGLTWKEKLAYLAYQFRKAPQTECPVTHIFQDGKYVREMKIPKDTLFIGRVHKVGHMIVLTEGKVRVISETDSRLHEAPDVMKSAPGYQMVAYMLTDVTARTIHPDTGEREVEKLEEQIFESADSITALGESIERKLLT